MGTRELHLLSLLSAREMYGLEIRDAYEEQFGQPLPLGSLYVTLDRLETKGLVSSRQGESTAARGGNRRRYFDLTSTGSRFVRGTIGSINRVLEAH